MGKWGTGPFHNDPAMDLLEELAEFSGEQRQALLRQLFAAVLRDPDAETFEVAFPEGYTDGLNADEVVAGAVVVALSLPGGERILEVETDQAFPGAGIPDLVAGAAVPVPTHDLAAMAAEALRAVTDSARSWSASWVDDGDRDLALLGVGETLRVLDSFTGGR
jgi:hypothetical protein